MLVGLRRSLVSVLSQECVYKSGRRWAGFRQRFWSLKRGSALIARFRDRYLAAMECLERDLEECVTYLRFPGAHHRRIRTTNRVERLNGESRRRTKVIPRFPTERACLTLLYASLVTASKRWRGIPMAARIVQQLQALRPLSSANTEEAVA